MSAEPFCQQVASSDRRPDAWAVARAIAPVLVRARLTPEYGVRVTTRRAPGKFAWYVVEIVGPGPLPDDAESSVRRQLLGPRNHRGANNGT